MEILVWFFALKLPLPFQYLDAELFFPLIFSLQHSVVFFSARNTAKMRNRFWDRDKYKGIFLEIFGKIRQKKVGV